jgi:hypothetical protein
LRAEFGYDRLYPLLSNLPTVPFKSFFIGTPPQLFLSVVAWENLLLKRNPLLGMFALPVV